MLPPENQNKTFDLNAPGGYLDKLEWEFSNMMRSHEVGQREMSYHFINFSVTAWHMADWTFPFLSSGCRENLNISTLGCLQKYLLAKSSYIKMCREVATAGKHFSISRNPNGSIITMPVNIQVLDKANPRVVSSWLVSIEGGWHAVDEIASGSILFWKDFLVLAGLRTP